MRLSTVAGMFAVMLICNSGQAFAQQKSAAPKAYFQLGPLLIVQPSGHISHNHVSPPIGGATAGGAAAAGVKVSAHFAVEVEATVSRLLKGSQRFSYYIPPSDYLVESRDVLFFANVRWSPKAAGALELFGGAGVARDSFAKRQAELGAPYDQRSEVDLALGGGVAARFPIGRRIELVPQASLRWIMRRDFYSNAAADVGVGNFKWQFGVLLRLRSPQ